MSHFRPGHRTLPVGSFKLLDAPGTGHVSQGMNTRFCVGCATSRPTAGGFFRQTLFFCSLHERRKEPR